MTIAALLGAALLIALAGVSVSRHRAARRAEESLRAATELNQQILDHAAEGVILLDRELRYQLWNSFMEDMSGLSASEVIGRKAVELFPHLREEGVEAYMQMALEGTEVVTPEVRYHGTATDRTGWASALFRPQRNERGEVVGILGLVRDVTLRRQAEDQIEYQALHDVLTGLGNRAMLHDRLSLALAFAQRRKRVIAVMIIDFDHFKIVNDTFGHGFGDALLKELGQRLKGCVRRTDTVARLGGDEFAIVVQDMERQEDAADLSAKIRAAIAELIEVQGRKLYVTASIGVAIYPNDGSDAETLLKNADNATHRAKAEGRDNVQLCTDELRKWAQERLELEAGLHRALARGEFVLHYQPAVDLRTYRINGMEALLRWEDPERGLLPPGAFISLAEERGFIVRIGAWVLRAACVQAREFQKLGFPDFRVAVNLSPNQFRDPGLLQHVSDALDESGLDPQCLELEITESIAMHDVDHTLRVLNALRLRGITIAIDDFGTGHSSLSYLKRFTVDALKIDRVFINDLATADGDQAIVASIIKLAHGLRLRVIAEGVEREDQLAFLKRNGCEEVQGFLFSYPLPAADFERLLSRPGEMQPLPDFSRPSA
jgi:diguanylate cyclase (GGDEF)-like protein/PAS domain S-box-containing protein